MPEATLSVAQHRKCISLACYNRTRDAPDICAWSCLDLLGREPEVSESVLCQLIMVAIEDQIVKGADYPRELAADHKLLHELPARRDVKV